MNELGKVLVTAQSEVIEVRCGATAYGRYTTNVVRFDKSHYISDDSWLCRLIQALAQKTKHAPEHAVKVRFLRDILILLKSSTKWRQVAQRQPESLIAADLIDCYRELETNNFPPTVSPGTINGLSAFRQYIKEYLVKELRLENCRKLYTPYKSTLKARKTGRGTISDALDRQSPIPEPLGALSHRNVAELREKSVAKRKATLQRLKDGVALDIQSYRERCEWLAQIEAAKLPRSQQNELLHMIGCQGPLANNIVEKYPPPIRLAYLLQQARKLKPTSDGSYPRFSIAGYSKIASYLQPKFGGRAERFWQIFYFPELGNRPMIHAALLSLQIATGWNVSSVLSLERSECEEQAGGYLIQSAKSKTDDDTPPVFISEKDEEAYFLLDWLIRRNAALRRISVYGGSKLFAATLYGGERLPAIQAMKDAFIERHGLPKYSFEQVRNEVLALTNMEEGFEAARQKAGHAGYGMLHTYVDDNGAQTINSSINLEFARRVENDIRLAISRGIEASKTWPSLSPIGDGSSCMNALTPPDANWLVGEICGAEHCHSAGGCSNRIFSIDERRLEEIAFTVLFYKRSSERLISRNKHYFFEVHWPRAIVASTLERLVREGPFRDRMAAAMDAAQKELNDEVA